MAKLSWPGSPFRWRDGLSAGRLSPVPVRTVDWRTAASLIETQGDVPHDTKPLLPNRGCCVWYSFSLFVCVCVSVCDYCCFALCWSVSVIYTLLADVKGQSVTCPLTTGSPFRCMSVSYWTRACIFCRWFIERQVSPPLSGVSLLHCTR